MYNIYTSRFTGMHWGLQVDLIIPRVLREAGITPQRSRSFGEEAVHIAFNQDNKHYIKFTTEYRTPGEQPPKDSIFADLFASRQDEQGVRSWMKFLKPPTNPLLSSMIFIGDGGTTTPLHLDPTNAYNVAFEITVRSWMHPAC
jgi:hypothetical protein